MYSKVYRGNDENVFFAISVNNQDGEDRVISFDDGSSVIGKVFPLPNNTNCLKLNAVGSIRNGFY